MVGESSAKTGESEESGPSLPALPSAASVVADVKALGAEDVLCRLFPAQAVSDASPTGPKEGLGQALELRRVYGRAMWGSTDPDAAKDQDLSRQRRRLQEELRRLRRQLPDQDTQDTDSEEEQQQDLK